MPEVSWKLEQTPESPRFWIPALNDFHTFVFDFKRFKYLMFQTLSNWQI